MGPKTCRASRSKGKAGVTALVVSFAVGLVVGVFYAIARVKSPAPPIVALCGLFGMIVGEQFPGWIGTLLRLRQ